MPKSRDVRRIALALLVVLGIATLTGILNFYGFYASRVRAGRSETDTSGLPARAIPSCAAAAEVRSRSSPQGGVSA